MGKAARRSSTVIRHLNVDHEFETERPGRTDDETASGH